MVSEAPANRIERIVAILVTPKAEWAKIEAEPATVRGIMTGWVAPLAAIGPVAKLIGSQLDAYASGDKRIPPPFSSALTEAVISYGLSLAAIYALSRIINGLAVTFKGQRDEVQAMKVAAYGATAAYLAGALEIWSKLEIFEVIGLYSLYLIFSGLPVVMKAPKRRVLAYTAVTLLAAIGLTILLTLIVLWTKGMFTPEIPASALNYTPPE